MPATTHLPAFPAPEASLHDTGVPTVYSGLSKLECLSALILAGLAADPGCTPGAIETAVDWAERLLEECATREEAHR